MEDLFLPYNLAVSTYNVFSISIVSRIFTLSLNGKDITASLRLRSTTLMLWGHYYGK